MLVGRRNVKKSDTAQDRDTKGIVGRSVDAFSIQK